MTDAPTPLPAGWYPDPNGGEAKLYWDGRAWHTASTPSAPPAAPTRYPTAKWVSCVHCQHVQREPVGVESFECAKCGRTLRLESAAPTKEVQPPPSSGDNRSKSTAIGIGVLVMTGIGLFMSMFTSVSLLSGTTVLWAGVAVAGLGTALAFILGAANGVRVASALCLGIALASTLYMEHQLDQKRNEISKVFHNGP